MQQLDTIICGRNEEVLSTFPDACIDLTVTSPPYDDLRRYNGYAWNFEETARQLYRVTKQGGVVVWVVSDGADDFCESLTSFKQAIYLVEGCGFNLLDTMFYQKIDYPPAYPAMKRYAGVIEYMFVLSRGKPKTFNPIMTTKADATIKRQKYKQRVDMRQADGSQITNERKIDTQTKAMTNLWPYRVGGNYTADAHALQHPGRFPERLAEDHILSWSNPGDVVLDPFIGSGTTAKMAIKHHRRYIGVDISPEYCDLARKRIEVVQPVLFDTAKW